MTLAASPLQLTRLRIDKYRRVIPGTELYFDGGINALLGRNGSGKTTLLRIISMCFRSDFSELSGEAFALEYDLRLPYATVCVTIAGGPMAPREESALDMRGQLDYDVAICVQGDDLGRHRLHATRTSLEIETPESDKIVGGMLSSSARLLVTHAFFTLFQSLMPVSPDAAKILEQIAWDVHNHGQSVFRFDESLGLLRAMEGNVEAKRWGHDLVIPTLVRTEKGLGILVAPLIPKSLKDALYKTDSSSGELGTGLTIADTHLPFLRKFVQLARIKRAEMKLSLLEKEVLDSGERFHFGDATFMLHLNDGAIIGHDLASFGQKRLLAFMYYLACNDAAIVADELVNGLHHEWIEACLEAIEERQTFLASQNPLLLDYMPIASSAQAAKCFIQCRIEERDGREWMRWSNMSDADAEAFYAAYAAGIQHVSEILRTEGLW